jgi:predicted transcriptional regulator
MSRILLIYSWLAMEGGDGLKRKLIELPDELFESLFRLAKKHRRRLSAEIVWALEQYVAMSERLARLASEHGRSLSEEAAILLARYVEEERRGPLTSEEEQA